VFQIRPEAILRSELERKASLSRKKLQQLVCYLGNNYANEFVFHIFGQGFSRVGAEEELSALADTLGKRAHAKIIISNPLFCQKRTSRLEEIIFIS